MPMASTSVNPMVRVSMTAARSAAIPTAWRLSNGVPGARRAAQASVPNVSAMYGNSLRIPFRFSHAPGNAAKRIAAAMPQTGVPLTRAA
jgi:hypothetical protein